MTVISARLIRVRAASAPTARIIIAMTAIYAPTTHVIPRLILVFIQTMPPLAMTIKELKKLSDVVYQSIKKVTERDVIARNAATKQSTV